MEPIVVGVDDSEGARDALRWALDHAKNVGAPVVAVRAMEPPQIVGRALTLDDLNQLDGIRAATGEWVREFVDSVRGADRSVEVKTLVLEGHPANVLTDESKDAQLVVVGARGAGLFHRLLLGSVSTGVLHHAHCSVVVVRPGGVDMTARRRVIVGYDGSPDAEVALAWAAAWTRAHDAVLTIVRAWVWPTYQGVPIVFGHIDPIHDMKVAVEAAATSTRLPDEQLETLVVNGSPSAVLVERSKDAELVVLGRRGVGGFQQLLLGSVSNQCVAHAHCAVAIVTPPTESRQLRR